MTIQAISKEFIDYYNSAIKEIQEKGQQKLKEVFKLFWESNPNVHLITWTQYTPYFNDGSECVFSLGEIIFSNLADSNEFENIVYDTYEGDLENIWVSSSDGDWKNGKLKKDSQKMDYNMAKELSNFLQSDSMEDVLKLLFEDHVKVFATREGFTAVYYEHD